MLESQLTSLKVTLSFGTFFHVRIYGAALPQIRWLFPKQKAEASFVCMFFSESKMKSFWSFSLVFLRFVKTFKSFICAFQSCISGPVMAQ